MLSAFRAGFSNRQAAIMGVIRDTRLAAEASLPRVNTGPWPKRKL
jgi:hypothetical protein